MSTEHKRRNSLERYQPRKPLDNDDELAPSLDKLSLNSNDGSFEAFSKDNSYKPSGRNNRRGVNSHLYANSRGGGERGGGRGRGRGRCQDGGRAQSHFNSVNDERQGDNNHSLNQNKGQHASWSKGENENKQHHNNVTYTPYQHGRQQRNDIPTNNYSNTPRIKNTENFKPSHKPTDMRILTAHSGWKKYEREIQSRDVMIVHDLFCQPSDLSIYEKLLGEIKSSGIDQEDLWKLWHGDSHVIADDKKRWKDSCPTFHMVLDRIQEYFDMDIEGKMIPLLFITVFFRVYICLLIPWSRMRETFIHAVEGRFHVARDNDKQIIKC